MNRRAFLPLIAFAALLLAGCVEEPPPPPVPDMVPLGEGLKVIGYALVGAAVILTLGRLVR